MSEFLYGSTPNWVVLGLCALLAFAAILLNVLSRENLKCLALCRCVLDSNSQLIDELADVVKENEQLRCGESPWEPNTEDEWEA